MKMSGGNIKINDWLWVMYPVLVVFLMIFGLSYFLGSGEVNLARFAAKQEETEAQEKIVNELKAKVASLKQVDNEVGLMEMQKMLVAMPASKKAWLLVAQLQNAATISSAVVAAYKADVGDVKEASESAASDLAYNSPLVIKVDYELANFESLITILQTLERYMPLAKVRKIEYALPLSTLTIEGAWLPWKPVTVTDMGNIVPDYKPGVNKALEIMTAMEEITGSGGVTIATDSAS